MRKLMFGVVLAVLVALPAVVQPRSEHRVASPAGVGVSSSAGVKLRSSLGMGIAPEPLTVRGPVSVSDRPRAVEGAFGLLPNYPNPFNPTTIITYRPRSDERVELAVYDVSGRLVRTLAGSPEGAGDLRQVVWDGTGDGGEQLPSGVYLLRLLDGTTVETCKLVLLK